MLQVHQCLSVFLGSQVPHREGKLMILRQPLLVSTPVLSSIMLCRAPGHLLGQVEVVQEFAVLTRLNDKNLSSNGSSGTSGNI